MSDRDIYEILESLDAAQRSVKQLPALFKPAQTSPQLDGAYPGRNATRGYMVGEDDSQLGTVLEPGIENTAEYKQGYNDTSRIGKNPYREGTTQWTRWLKGRMDRIGPKASQGSFLKNPVREGSRYDHENPMARAVHIRIINQHPEWIIKYGVEELMQAIEDVVPEGPVLASEVQDMIRMIGDTLRDRKGGREEMDSRRPFAEQDGRDDDEEEIDDDGMTMADRARRDGRGGDDESENPMAQAVARRIVNQHPELLMKYGPSEVMQAIDDVTEGNTDWEEIGSSDVSAYIEYVKDHLRDHHGGREEMDRRKPFAEDEHISPSGVKTNMSPTDDDYEINYGRDGLAGKIKESLRAGEYHLATVTLDDGSTHEIKIRSDEGFREPIERHFKKQGKKVTDIDVDWSVRSDVYEGRDTATEDVLSTMKKKLGDYLQDVATAIKRDPDLIDQIPGTADQIRVVKTIKTDDGHEIKIHGTEDDGFRISIKNKDAKTKFDNLDEAVMAVEMYCARRRQQALEADYIDEKTS
jgi:hypothetical protein